VPEVIEDGVTGFIVNSEEEALAAIARVGTLDRARIRAEFERRFSSRSMARTYVDVYTNLLTRHRSRRIRKSTRERSSCLMKSSVNNAACCRDSP
jgi:hypothetical protein